MKDPEKPLFRRLAGLPPYGPIATSFPPSFEGHEGLVVEFLPATEGSWVGNFRPGLGGYNGAHLHPNQHQVVVFCEGQAYVVDPAVRTARQEIEGAIFEVWEVADPAGLILDRQGLAFERISAKGLMWHTRRLSWDGFRDVWLSCGEITGQAWSPIEHGWITFRVNLATGQSEGGALGVTGFDHWERLAT